MIKQIIANYIITDDILDKYRKRMLKIKSGIGKKEWEIFD